jgi:acetyl-CoA carboxylase biotin carboxyl carrier protein
MCDQTQDPLAIDLEGIAELMRQMKANGISRLDLDTGALKLSLERGAVRAETTPVDSLPVPAPSPAPAPAPTPAPSAPPPAAAPSEDIVAPIGHLVKSPIVGIFYSSPAPDAPAFVSVGAAVTPGQTLCIIEAMKLMNEVSCPVAGTVAEILVRNGDRVEYGQPMLRIV